MKTTTYNFRIFNFATGEFDGTVTLTIGPRRHQAGYMRSRRTSCYNVIYDGREVRVDPVLFRRITGKSTAEIAGVYVFTADELALMGFEPAQREAA
ncbi:hypothetical protein [Paenibacillus luteus]|uniref:hypothetical protein n=1 Tax=Paenibacillus luteus TaxID=2545753 RepID=UPI001141D4BF|nr:hypothetical protein [Paenibacillus luteus]